MLTGIQEELKANTEKSTSWLLGEGAVERRAILKRREKLIKLKGYQLA
jgi:hypothetical protein